MKIITFFTEKGGVGKSTFSIMYASWLRHGHGVSVALADFNNRIRDYRQDEITTRARYIKENPGCGLEPYDEQKTWPIVSANYSEIREIEKNGGAMYPYATWLNREIVGEQGRLKGFDVVLCDFPGSLEDNKFLHILGMRMLSMVVVPTEKDTMTRNSTLKVIDTLKEQKKAFYTLFLNKAQLSRPATRRQYESYAQKYIKFGAPILPDMVSYSERITSIDKISSIRNTFEYGDFTVIGKGENDLGIGNLFIDITRLLDKCPDYRGTGKADLSFVGNLEKKDDGRQLSGTMFPELEISK